MAYPAATVHQADICAYKVHSMSACKAAEQILFIKSRVVDFFTYARYIRIYLFATLEFRLRNGAIDNITLLQNTRIDFHLAEVQL